MTDPRGPSRNGRTTGSRSGRSVDLVIDGEATRIGRQASEDTAAPFRATDPARAKGPRTFDTPPFGTWGPRTQTFGRRGAAAMPAKRRPQGPDLFFQGESLSRFATPAKPRSVGGFVRAASDALPSAARSPRALSAGFGALAIAVLVPAMMLAAPERPVAAPYAGDSFGGFSIVELEAGIHPRGDGAILEIAGRITRTSGEAGAVPTLRIALSGADGTTLARPVAVGGKALNAGETVSFRSAVAVPAGTVGDVSVGFTRPDAGSAEDAPNLAFAHEAAAR